MVKAKISEAFGCEFSRDNSSRMTEDRAGSIGE